MCVVSYGYIVPSISPQEIKSSGNRVSCSTWPSTARDSVATAFNFLGGDAWYNVTVRNDTQYFSDIDYYSSKVTAGVDFRAKNFDSIENLETNSLDFYASVKSLYLQDRQQKILNSKKIINTQDDSDWEEIQN